jgi:hypothetical protein
MMKNKVHSMLLSAAGAATLVFATAEAKASYICHVTFDPHPVHFNSFSGDTYSYGNYGFLEVTLYTQPNCAGTYDGYVAYCTSGATPDTIDTCDATHYPSSTQMLALFESMQRAAAAKQRVYLATSFSSSSPNAGTSVTFYSAQ